MQNEKRKPHSSTGVDEVARGDILMLCHRIPYPPDKGDKIRSYNMLMHLVRSGWQVHLGALVDHPDDLKHYETLRSICGSVKLVNISSFGRKLASVTGVLNGTSMSVVYFHHPELQRWVNERVGILNFHAVFCVCAPMAEYVFSNPTLGETSRDTASKRKRPPRLLMDFMDVDSEKWRDYASAASFPQRWMYRLEGLLLRRYERKIVNRFHDTMLVSEAEVALFRKRVSTSGQVWGVSNGVDLEVFEPFPPIRNYRMYFCGAMDYLPNIDAVEWFVNSAFPMIRKELPNAEFVIVGSNPSLSVQRLASFDGVTVTGKVTDVRPYIAESTLCVVPLRIARGLQNKVLEAMSMAKPVIATHEAVTGIAGESGRDFIAEQADPKAFSITIVELLRNPERAEEIGRNGRRVVEKVYRWSSCLRKIDELLQ